MGCRREQTPLDILAALKGGDSYGVAAVLPGAYYMDPPDGGDVPVSEQLRRMAKDAVDEIERMRSALDWYAAMAKTMQRATLHVDNQVALHVMKQMALDGGKKAREAMTHNAEVKGGCAKD